MNLRNVNGDVFDLDQIASTDIQVDCVRLHFRNGDEISFQWRDALERQEVFSALQPSTPVAPASS